MKFALYHSVAEQSYTLLKANEIQDGGLEDDAIVVREFNAKDWDDAKKQQARFLYNTIFIK